MRNLLRIIIAVTLAFAPLAAQANPNPNNVSPVTPTERVAFNTAAGAYPYCTVVNARLRARDPIRDPDEATRQRTIAYAASECMTNMIASRESADAIRAARKYWNLACDKLDQLGADAGFATVCVTRVHKASPDPASPDPNGGTP